MPDVAIAEEAEARRKQAEADEAKRKAELKAAQAEEAKRAAQAAIVDTAPPIRKRRYGVGPPPTFDFDRLPDSGWLLTDETAAVLRVAPGTVASWRFRPGHRLRWELVDGRPRYKVGWLRDFIAGK